ncbi:hypothetical protein KP001_16305 [Geomonas subterranea]|uniref:Uncharacterized protein n=1 Tax=Geomonas subterranea TaxID=2847989 RepID=A0ABX8LE16_9BACT|nr:hypothetical protein [Geomonas subterranea]QXE89968.1 hypothetical protein KP001_16305 [Geomonas subterranea]QXM07912.1 hypothetical protein KP002_12975 [Geomonas subterranea]
MRRFVTVNDETGTPMLEIWVPEEWQDSDVTKFLKSIADTFEGNAAECACGSMIYKHENYICRKCSNGKKPQLKLVK